MDSSGRLQNCNCTIKYQDNAYCKIIGEFNGPIIIKDIFRDTKGFYKR